MKSNWLRESCLDNILSFVQIPLYIFSSANIILRRGLIVIATSNREPDKLYENGLQRQNFLPFIPILTSQCKVVNLDSGMDYRRSETFDFNYPSWLEKNNTEQVDFHLNRLYTEYGDGSFEVEFENYHKALSRYGCQFSADFPKLLEGFLCYRRSVVTNSLKGTRVDRSWT